MLRRSLTYFSMLSVIKNNAVMELPFPTMSPRASLRTLLESCNCRLLPSDNAVLVQSRFILMEPFLLLFSVLGIFCLVRFRQYRNRPFSLAWCGWLTAGFVFLGAATR